MTYILMWNPAVSSMTVEQWDKMVRRFPFIETNWSVHEVDKSDYWDSFYMVKVGSGNTGIVMKGHFSSLPYPGRDWSGKDRHVFYRDLNVSHIFNPESPVISTSELASAIPDFDWKGGHSGRCLTEEQAEKLDCLWTTARKAHADIFATQEVKWDMVIDPLALEKVTGGHVWNDVICNLDFGKDPMVKYSDVITHDCVNLRFAEDYDSHVFSLKEWFIGGVLDIRCSKLTSLKMNLDNMSTAYGDFKLSLPDGEHFHLYANGVEVWCGEMEFSIDTGYKDDGFVPVSI